MLKDKDTTIDTDVDTDIDSIPIDSGELEPAPVPAPAPTLELEPQGSKWDWVGSPSRPEAQVEDDGISDLFRVTDEDVGASDDDLSDLTDVDMERDVLDAGPDGSLDDLVDVTEEDIMGDDRGQRPSRPASQQRKPRYRITPRYFPPTSMGRSG
jgi:hypothetical protein